MQGRGRLRGIVESAAVGYLLGSVPSSDWVGEAASRGARNVRRDGTGNPGALNAAQVLGRGWGAAVLVADVGKAWCAAGLGRRQAGPLGANVAASCAVIGHCFPAARRFRGGKGVACSGGQVLGTMPLYFPLDLVLAGLTARVTRRTDLATLVGAVGWVTTATVFWRRGINPGGVRPTVALPVAAALSSAVIGYRFLVEGRPPVEHRYGTDHAPAIPASV